MFVASSDPDVLWVELGLISAASRERWQCDLRKTSRADKQSVFVSAQTPHFHFTKGSADFYNSRSSRAHFPGCPGEKTPHFFSYRSWLLHKRCPASVCLFSAGVLIGFL